MKKKFKPNFIPFEELNKLHLQVLDAYEKLASDNGKNGGAAEGPNAQNVGKPPPEMMEEASKVIYESYLAQVEMLLLQYKAKYKIDSETLDSRNYETIPHWKPWWHNLFFWWWFERPTNTAAILVDKDAELYGKQVHFRKRGELRSEEADFERIRELTEGPKEPAKPKKTLAEKAKEKGDRHVIKRQRGVFALNSIIKSDFRHAPEPKSKRPAFKFDVDECMRAAFDDDKQDTWAI